MSAQSLKAANLVRVDPGKADTLYSAARTLGEGLMCVAGAHVLQNDVYGRPASQNTLSVNLDPSCGMQSQYPAQRQIQIENQVRPYLPICSAGLRGAGDFAALGRDISPRNLYGEGHRGNNVRVYDTPNDQPLEVQPPPMLGANFSWNRKQPFDFSHDATRSAFSGR